MGLDWEKANRRDRYRKCNQQTSKELPPTYKQLCYLESLIRKRGEKVSYELLKEIIPTQAEASTLIQQLK